MTLHSRKSFWRFWYRHRVQFVHRLYKKPQHLQRQLQRQMQQAWIAWLISKMRSGQPSRANLLSWLEPINNESNVKLNSSATTHTWNAIVWKCIEMYGKLSLKKDDATMTTFHQIVKQITRENGIIKTELNVSRTQQVKKNQNKETRETTTRVAYKTAREHM